MIDVVHKKDCCNNSKLDTSCNARLVEVAKVPVDIAARGFLAFLLMDPKGAERQQKYISNYKKMTKTQKNPITQPLYTYLRFLQQD